MPRGGVAGARGIGMHMVSVLLSEMARPMTYYSVFKRFLHRNPANLAANPKSAMIAKAWVRPPLLILIAVLTYKCTRYGVGPKVLCVLKKFVARRTSVY